MISLKKWSVQISEAVHITQLDMLQTLLERAAWWTCAAAAELCTASQVAPVSESQSPESWVHNSYVSRVREKESEEKKKKQIFLLILNTWYLKYKICL